MDDIRKKIEQINKAGKLPAFSYDRVSTEEQAKRGSSLQNQADWARRYADNNGLIIVQEFTASESAFKEGRAVFNEMLTLAEKHDIKDLIFKNIDRLSRNETDHARIKKLYRQKGYRIHIYELGTILHENSTAEHELLADNTAVMAKYWSNKISQGVRAANRSKTTRGTQPGRPPFGYLYDYDKKQFKIDPEKKSLLNKIFKDYDHNGLSIQMICDKLNAAGQTSPKGRKWQKAHLHYIISNPIYAGYFIGRDGKEHNANHDVYISRERFEERRFKMQKSFRGTRKRDTNYLFSGLLRYEKTGRMLTGEMHKGHIYYGHRNPNVMFREDQIIISIMGAAAQFQAWDEKRRKQFDKNVSEEVEKIIKEITTDKRPLKKSLLQKIGNLKAEEKRLLKLFSQDSISKDSLFESIEEIKGERKECEERLRKIDIYDFTHAEEFKRNISLFFENDFESEERIKLLRLIVDYVIIPDYVKTIDAKYGNWEWPKLDPNKPMGAKELYAEICKPVSAQIVFKRQYRPLFDYITEVRNRQEMLPG